MITIESTESFGQRLRTLRKNRGLRLQDVADWVTERLQEQGGRSVDPTYLSKIENERVPPPSVAVILQLATLLNTNGDELLALAGKAPPDLGSMLQQSRGARLFFRRAQRLDLDEDEWLDLVEQLPARPHLSTPLRHLDDKTVAFDQDGVTFTVTVRPDERGWPFYFTDAQQGERTAMGRMLHYTSRCHELEFPDAPDWLRAAVPEDAVTAAEGRTTLTVWIDVPPEVRVSLRAWMEEHNAETRVAARHEAGDGGEERS